MNKSLNNKHMKNIIQILSIANKVKTPISLVSLAIIILYLILKQILDMDIYTKVGEENTRLLIENVLSKIFWFAIIALAVGVLLYILSFTLKKQNNPTLDSDVKLISSSIDSKMSAHNQIIDSDGKIIIKPNKNDKNK